METTNRVARFLAIAEDQILTKLAPEQREELLGECLEDISRLEHVLGESFDDWRSVTGRDSFAGRSAP